MHIILASPDSAEKNSFIAALEQEGFEVAAFATGQEALAFAEGSAPDAVLFDELITDVLPLDFLRELLLMNAAINTAVLSARSHEDFDEYYEGYGVLMPLPASPGAEDAARLAQKVRAVQL